MNVTNNELLVLQAILNSEYQNGSTEAKHVVLQQVWTDYINPFDKLNTLPGVVASLSKKGLVGVYKGTTKVTGNDPSRIWLTQAGFDIVGVKPVQEETAHATETKFALSPMAIEHGFENISMRPGSDRWNVMRFAFCGKLDTFTQTQAKASKAALDYLVKFGFLVVVK